MYVLPIRCDFKLDLIVRYSFLASAVSFSLSYAVARHSVSVSRRWIADRGSQIYNNVIC